jgi:hypothetical protein
MFPTLISIFLALLPLAGVAWVVTQDSITTVDGLFMSLLLLTISGVLFLNGALELREMRKRKKSAAPAARKLELVVSGGGLGRARGRVESVLFFEAPVGVTDKSIVTLRNGAGAHVLAFEGDLRNVLPTGKQVAISYRSQGTLNDLVSVDFSSKFPSIRERQAA